MTIASCDDIDAIASVCNQGTAVPITIFATYREWAQTYPAVYNRSLTRDVAPVRHCVCVLPNGAFVKDGVKYLAIQDSAHFGGLHRRYLSEDFIRARCYGSLYFLPAAPSVPAPTQKPKLAAPLSSNLKVGSRGPDVSALQAILAYEGLLDVKPTGYFGGLTMKAVKAYQSKHGIEAVGEVGPKTRAAINAAYA